jgi:hypothetical protein
LDVQIWQNMQFWTALPIRSHPGYLGGSSTGWLPSNSASMWPISCRSLKKKK